MSDDYDDEWDAEEDDGLDQCGRTPDGICMLAGTEFCDFECPIGSQPMEDQS